MMIIRNRKHNPDKWTIKKCPVCGREFGYYAAHLQKYCSKLCEYKGRGYRHFTLEEDDYIREHYGYQTITEIARHLGCNKNSVTSHIYHLRIIGHQGELNAIKPELVEDIKEFVRLHHRKPDKLDIVTWLEMKDLPRNDGWIDGLIEEVTKDMVITPKEYSDFILYGEPQNQVPSFVLHKLNGMQKPPKEIE